MFFGGAVTFYSVRILLSRVYSARGEKELKRKFPNCFHKTKGRYIFENGEKILGDEKVGGEISIDATKTNGLISVTIIGKRKWNRSSGTDGIDSR